MKVKIEALDRVNESLVFSVSIKKEQLYFDARRMALIEKEDSGIGRHQITNKSAYQLLKSMDIEVWKSFDFMLVIAPE